MKSRLALAGALLLGIVIPGCAPAPEEVAAPNVDPVPAQSGSEESSESVSGDVSASIPVSGLEISSRGIPISGVGLVNTIYEGDVLLTSWVVNAIEVDPECTSDYPEPPENGFFVALSIDWETFPELANDPVPEIWLEDNWRVIADNGTTFSGFVDTWPAEACLNEREGLPDFLGPGEKATGVFILDVPTASGTLIRDSLELENAREIPYP